MANETIIFQAEKLFVTVAGRRITALPATGDIVTLARVSPRAVFVEALFGTSQHAIKASRGKLMTVLVSPNSADDAWMWETAEAIETLGKLAPVTLSYQNTQFISGGCSIPDDPVRAWSVDGGAFMAWSLQGIFPVGKVGKFIAPPALTEQDVSG